MTSGLDMSLQDLPTCSFTCVHQATAAVSKTLALAPHFVRQLTLIALLICSANVTEKVAILKVQKVHNIPTLDYLHKIEVTVTHRGWYMNHRN